MTKRTRTLWVSPSLTNGLAIILLFGVATSPSHAQQAPASQTSPQNSTEAPPPKSDGQAKPDNNKPSVTQPTDDRLFFALPNYLTLDNGSVAPPLSAKQKFILVTHGAFDPFQFGWYAALSGISQAENSEPGYGQGLEGYAKRYGSEFGDGTIENYMVGAIFPSVLHQDPRFYREPSGSFKHRAFYAVSRIFVTRSDSGHAEFNFSEIFGAGAAASISTYTYHPQADRTLTNTASVWGTEIGYDTLTIVIKEFWPDVRRVVTHKKSSAQ